MMQGPHQVPFIPGHPMAMAQRPVRGRVYSSSPLGSSPMQGYMQYQVAGQVRVINVFDAVGYKHQQSIVVLYIVYCILGWPTSD